MRRATVIDKRHRFEQLHHDGLFVMANAWDVGSARLLADLGFPALATTSSGHAASLGRLDYRVTRDELLAHVAALATAVDVPLNVDAERCFPDTSGGVAETVRLLAEAGAAGCSIEDYDPATGTIDPIDVAADRVAAATETARAHGLVLTARAENHAHRIGDLDDTVARLQAYREAGAAVVYAPGLTSLDDIARVIAQIDAPLNVLVHRAGPSVRELETVGVRRVSTGGALAFAAYGALVAGARELLEQGTSTYTADALTNIEMTAAFTGQPL